MQHRHLRITNEALNPVPPQLSTSQLPPSATLVDELAVPDGRPDLHRLPTGSG